MNKQKAIEVLKNILPYESNFAEARQMAIEALSIDIVRCKECKHYRTDIPQVGGTYNGCGVWIDEGNEIEVEPNQFCSYGERKDNE